MVSPKPILFISGITLGVLALSMSIPMMVDLYLGHEDWKTFAACMTFTAFIAGAFALGNKSPNLDLGTKDIFLITTISWLLATLFAAMPFKFSELDLSTQDAVFEAMSGLTTTGATVIENLETIPPGILIWRATLQWLGGIAILVMALAVLPHLRVGGMQIFRSETQSADKARPRLVTQITGILSVYLILSGLCTLGYIASGLNAFDSFAHAMATISTGGFSTYSGSFITINNTAAETVALLFMVLSGMPFILFLKTAQGKARGLFKDSQTKSYLAILTVTSAILALWLYIHTNTTVAQSLFDAAFNIASIMTGTGFANTDFALWATLGGSFGMALLLFLMAVGGCAGSTTCGIKIFRFQILYAVCKSQIEKLLSPSGVILPRYQGKTLQQDSIISVMAFFLTFALLFALAVLGLSALNVDLTTAVSAAIACLSNVGPGFGDIIGPTGTYAALPSAAKWILSACMFLGRLEFFTILVMLSPYFWRR